jgi:hypothetical protein
MEHTAEQRGSDFVTTAVRAPGESSSVPVHFRDPPPPDAEAAAVKLEIARILVRAPTLPIELPVFKLTLLDVEAGRRGIDLLIGKSSPIARLRLKPADKNEPIPLGKPPAVSVSVEPIHSDATRFEKELRTMADRIRSAVTAEQWEQARTIGKKLQSLPVGVPLGFFRQIVAGVVPIQGLVRTGFNCNQDCGICWQGRDWGRFGADQVRTWIEDLYNAGARQIIISGGEPTLDPELESYVRLAKQLGFVDITLETNAIQFAKAGVAQKFRDAGVTDCFVSLHSGNAEVSDAITRAPGTHVRTVKGIQALLAANVKVNLNCVMTNEGLDHLSGLPDFIHESFGKHPLLDGLMISLPTNSFDPSLDATIIPEPTKLRRILKPTIDRAFALGIVVRGLDGPCGPPLCAFGADRRIASLNPIPESLDFRQYLPGCNGCSVRSACFGVRSGQAALYGDACIQPITSLAAA